MALITDPSDLADASSDGTSSVYINTSTKTVKLNSGQGSLTSDGVTLKALYSFLKEQWHTDPHTKNLAAFPFPMTPITDESFEFKDGWDFYGVVGTDDTSRELIRTGGWTVRNTSNQVTQKWAGIIGLGSIESNDQIYYYQGKALGETTDFVLQGQVNQAVLIYLDTNGDGTPDEDHTTNFTMFVREQGQIFGKASIADIGVSTMDSIAYRFPISTATDLKITAADSAIYNTGAFQGNYADMSITYQAAPTSTPGPSGGPYDFSIFIDGGGHTLAEVYNYVQYQLRQSGDIDDDTATVYGKIADPLLYYVGDTLYTSASSNPGGGGTGVFISNFDSNDQNSVFFITDADATVAYPYVATITVSFNPNLSGDTDAKYWVYLRNAPTGSANWGVSTAEVVLDASSNPMSGNISSSTSVTHTYDYDASTQGGRVTNGANSPVQDVKAVAIGLFTGQYVNADGTIARSKTNAVALVAPLERNYDNPV